jgi:hypothetical protein
MSIQSAKRNETLEQCQEGLKEKYDSQRRREERIQAAAIQKEQIENLLKKDNDTYIDQLWPIPSCLSDVRTATRASPMIKKSDQYICSSCVRRPKEVSVE